MTRRVVVPMKALALSKTRLRAVLSDEQRELLSRAMLVRVLRAVMASEVVDEAIVVGGDDEISHIAGIAGASWRAEPGRELNETLSLVFHDMGREHEGAMSRPERRGTEGDGASAATGATCIDSVTYLPADLPLVTAADVTALVMSLTEPGTIAVAPDRRRQGTNGLTVPSRAPFLPLLGESSFEKHLKAIEGAGYTSRVCEREGLAFDVDIPADLDDLLRLDPSWWQQARCLAGADAGVGA